MTPHTSGTSLSAQARYAAGTREILECWLDGRPIREEYLIVDGGTLAGAGAHSYSEGDATGGSEEAARFTRLEAMKMRAAVLEEFGEPLAVQEVELAEPQAGEVLVRLAACGVCHTDLYTASGADPSGYAPTVLGHEGAGVVEQVGPDVASLAAGDHVVTLFSPQCRECVHCVDPRTNLCLAIRERAEQGPPPRRHDPDLPRRRRHPPLHGLLDLRRVHGDAGDRAGEGQPRGAVRARLPLRLRALDRPRRGDQHRHGRSRAAPASSSAPGWSASARSPAAACRAPSGSSASTSPTTGSSWPAARARPT